MTVLLVVIVFHFIPYIGDPSWILVSHEAEVPHSLTAFHLSLSDYPLRDSLLNTLSLRGVTIYSNRSWTQGFFSTGGGGWGGGQWHTSPLNHKPDQLTLY